MNIPDPEKLPSGRWRIRVSQNGRRVSRTFSDRREAIAWAAEVKFSEKELRLSPRSISLNDATDRYIESKDGILSPSTVAGYRRIKDCHFSALGTKRLQDIKQEQVQRWINQLSKEVSPKTVRNVYALFTAVMRDFGGASFNIALPQKERAEILVPSSGDIRSITAAVKGHWVELPVLLAMWLGLRMSEILGLQWQDVSGGSLHIRRAMVDEGLKTTKTYTSNRTLPLPRYLHDLIQAQPRTSEFICPYKRRSIWWAYTHQIEKAGIPHYRFHDLRHLNASVMLALGIPDKYAMQRMGHATNNMLKTVYQHTIKESEKEFSDRVDDYFDAILK